MEKLTLVLCVLGIFISGVTYAQIESEFTDSRDGKSYSTVILKYKTDAGVAVTQEWFSQNLDFEVGQSFCYKSEAAYCEVFGRLYLREASTVACPSGWHIPTSDEWQQMEV